MSATNSTKINVEIAATGTPLSKGDKREASSPLDAQGVQPETKKTRQHSGSSTSSTMDDADTASAGYPVHLLSQPMDPSDIVHIASELRSVMLPEISSLMKSQLPDIKAAVASAVKEVTATLKEELKTLREENAELREVNQGFETRLAQVESDNDALEQYTRRNSVRISGVPEEGGEDTDEIVLKIAGELDVLLSPSDIDRSHRVGKLEDSARAGARSKAKIRHRDIIVKFATYNARQRLYMKRTELRDSEATVNLYINEDLTKTRSKLLFDARSLVRVKLIKSAYSSDGKIFIRDTDDRRQLIKNDSDILKFGDPVEARKELAKMASPRGSTKSSGATSQPV